MRRSLADPSAAAAHTDSVSPDNGDERAPLLVISVTAFSRRPLAGQYRRLGAVLVVPDTIQRVIERLDADNAAV